MFVTAFYSFRMYFLVFHGQERFRDKPFPPEAHDDHAAHDTTDGHGADAHASHAEPDPHAHDAHAAPHESPWVVTLPLVLLAIPSVVIGFLTIGPMLFGDFFKDAIVVNAERHPAMEELAHGVPRPGGDGAALAHRPGLLARAGRRRRRPGSSTCAGPTSRRRSSAASPFIYACSRTSTTSTGSTRTSSPPPRACSARGLWKGGDVGLIDGVVINGSARAVGALRRARRRRLQTGYLYWYALVMILGVFGLMTWQLWPFLGNLIGH